MQRVNFTMKAYIANFTRELVKALWIFGIMLTLACLCPLTGQAAGSQMDSAEHLPFGTQTRASISYPGHWYSITASDSDTQVKIDIINVNISHLEARILNENGVRVENIEIKESDAGSLSCLIPKNNTYYIALDCGSDAYAGDYIITAASVSDDVPGSFRESLTIEKGAVFTGHLDFGGDTDCFRFITGNQPVWAFIKLDNGETCTAQAVLYDGNEALQDSAVSSPGQSITLKKKLKNNSIYFIKISAYTPYEDSNGSYQLSLTCQADEVGDNRKDSAKLPLNQSRTYSLAGSGDTDYFRFQTGTTRKYLIRLKNISSHDMTYTLKDQHNNEMDFDYVYDSGHSGTIAIRLEKNTVYYLAVTGRAAGKYTISVNTAVSSITVNKSRVTLNRKQKTTIRAKANPPAARNKKLTWYSRDETIATVSQKGVITARSPGVTYVVCSAADNYGTEKRIKVTVK